MDNITIPLGLERASGSASWSSGASFGMTVEWSTSPNNSAGFTTVSVTMGVRNASAQGTCKDGSYIIIDGNRSNFNGKYLDYPGSAPNIHLHSYSLNIAHTEARNVTISGAWSWEGYIWISGGYSGNFNTVSGSSSVYLDSLFVPPSQVSWCSIEGTYSKGHNTTIRFGGIAPATNYKIYFREWILDGDIYSAWNHHGYNSTHTGVYSINHDGGANGDAFQMGVSQINGPYESAIKPTEWIYHQGVNVNNNGFRPGQIRVWNGSSWTQGYVKVWNGSSWVRAQ